MARVVENLKAEDSRARNVKRRFNVSATSLYDVAMTLMRHHSNVSTSVLTLTHRQSDVVSDGNSTL